MYTSVLLTSAKNSIYQNIPLHYPTRDLQEANSVEQARSTQTPN